MGKSVRKVFCIILCLSLIAGIARINALSSAKQGFDKKIAKKNISVTYKETNDGVLASYKNKNSYAVSIKATISFIDAAGQTIKKESFKNNCFPKKKTVVYFFKGPVSETNDPIKYNNYKVSFKVSKTSGKDYSGKIKIIHKLEPTECICTAMNLSKKRMTSINVTFVFYNASGKIICVKNNYLNCKDPNTANDFTMTYAGLESPKKVKIYLNWAF